MRYLIPVFFLLASCLPQSQIHPPDNLLTVDEMGAILPDYYLAEAFGDREKAEGKDEFLVNQAHISGVLQKHNVTAERFFRSLSWYQQQPELFEQINTMALQELSRLDAEMRKKP